MRTKMSISNSIFFLISTKLSRWSEQCFACSPFLTICCLWRQIKVLENYIGDQFSVVVIRLVPKSENWYKTRTCFSTNKSSLNSKAWLRFSLFSSTPKRSWKWKASTSNERDRLETPPINFAFRRFDWNYWGQSGGDDELSRTCIFALLVPTNSPVRALYSFMEQGFKFLRLLLLSTDDANFRIHPFLAIEHGGGVIRCFFSLTFKSLVVFLVFNGSGC